MNTLKIIKDEDIGSDMPAPEIFQERRASRALVFDKENKVALLNASKIGYHKLPGGGIEKGEGIVEALRRETLEEIGCDVTNLRELGIIEEYRNAFSVHQISYCFIADLLGEKGTPNLEEDEIAEGFEPVWLSLDEAIRTLESEGSVKNYAGKFMLLRDLTFLKEAKNQ